MTENKKRLFSIEEIQKLLPDLEVRIVRFLEKKAAYLRMHDHLLMEELLCDIESRQNSSPGSSASDDEAEKLELTVSELEREIKELRRLGCALQDLEKGWIDFPAVLHDKPIFYCWKRGDLSIRFYRDFDNPASERMPLPSQEGC